MKKYLCLCIPIKSGLLFTATIFYFTCTAQVFWTEAFQNGCAAACFANTYVGPNGAWTQTPTGTNDPEANAWFVSGAECGNAAGQCGSVCGATDPSLHVGANDGGWSPQDPGAAYNAGGFCGTFFCVTANMRMESPVINCTGKSNITIAFNYIEDGDGTNDDATLWYYNGATWAQIDPLAKTPFGACAPQGKWTAFSMLLPASANNNANVKIGFNWTNNDDGAGTDPSFAVDDITLSVTGGSAPVANFSTTNTICAGQCINFTDLSSNAPTSWSWSFTGATPAASASQNPTNICYNTAGTYTATLTATNANGSSSTSQTITVNPLPTANAGSNVTICQGQSTTLNGTGGGTYAWSPTTALSNPNISNPVASPTTTTTYSVTVTNSCGSSTASVNVSVNPLPTATAGPNSTVCPSTTVTITATGGGTYAWNTGQTTASISVAPSATASYTVTVSNACGSSTASATVTISNTLVTTIAGSTTICSGQSATLTANGGNTFSWSTGGTNASVIVSPTATSSYTVYASSGTCADTVAATVTVTSPPSPSIAGNTTICSGQSATLTASGGNTYSWIPVGQTTSSVIVSPTATSTFTVIASIGSCSNTATTTVTVNPTPTAFGSNFTICSGTMATLNGGLGGNYSWSTGQTTSSIIVAPTTSTNYTVIVSNGVCTDTGIHSATVIPIPVASISGSTTICSGQMATLTASGGGTYSWSNSSTASTISVTPTSTTTYSVIATVWFCSDTTSATVFVSPPPVAIVSGGTTICSGNNATLTASGGGTYSWSTGSNNSSITVSPAVTTTYSVIVTNAGNCTASATATVNVDIPAANAGNSVSIVQGNSTALSASGGGTYSWNTGETSAGISVSPSATTEYCVYVADAKGCTDSACVTVYVEANCSNLGELYLPNAFSPNGDGQNDSLLVYYGNYLCIKTLSITIYNRWGEKVFHSDDPLFRWDGAAKGNKLDSGAYTYYLNATLNDNTEIHRKGTVNLMR